jgi:dienelactone hydrolase
MDLFGFFPQTVQGADILAHAGNFAVYMPDWFDGHPADISWYPPDTKEKADALSAFFAGPASLPVATARAREVVEELVKAGGEAAGKWGAVGLCWGGKVSILSPSSPDN